MLLLFLLSRPWRRSQDILRGCGTRARVNVEIYGCGDRALRPYRKARRTPGRERETRSSIRTTPMRRFSSRPIMGMDLDCGLQAPRAKASGGGGTIYDPRDGKTYKCAMSLKPDGTLEVRGYVGSRRCSGRRWSGRGSSRRRGGGTSTAPPRFAVGSFGGRRMVPLIAEPLARELHHAQATHRSGHRPVPPGRLLHTDQCVLDPQEAAAMRGALEVFEAQERRPPQGIEALQEPPALSLARGPYPLPLEYSTRSRTSSAPTSCAGPPIGGSRRRALRPSCPGTRTVTTGGWTPTTS